MTIAVECSAALPTIATTITPTNTSVTPNVARALSIVPTRNSESTATTAGRDDQDDDGLSARPMFALFFQLSLGADKKCLCVLSENASMQM